MCFVGQPAEGVGLTGSAEGGAKSHNPRERAQPRAELRWIRAWVFPSPAVRRGLAPWCR